MNKIINNDILDIISDFPGFEFRNKTVLITGASGFLASYLVFYFLMLNKVKNDQNCKVLALVRNISKAKIKFKSILNNDLFNLIEHDVNDYFNYNESIDFIFHAASQASPKYYKTDPVGTIRPNVLGTFNLLNLLRDKNTGCFVFFSSGEVYGQNESLEIKENDYGIINPILIRSCYGESKKIGENICVSYSAQYGIDTKIIRPFHIYGPGMELDDGRIQADFINDIVNKRNLKINSDGLATRSFCYIKDATKAFLLIAINGATSIPYNVGNPKQIFNIKNLANILIENCCDYNAKIIYKQANENYLKSSYSLHAPSISRIQNLGWNPETDISTGFIKTIKSYNG